MKSSEVIRKHYDKIAAAMVEKYRDVIECDGRIQYQIYIWDDGELEFLQDVQGGNSWLKARDGEPRKLYHVDTISECPGFDVWDYSESGKPDDDVDAEQMRDEIIDWLVESYEEGVYDRLDGIIKEIEQVERWQEEEY